ncbi:MAG: multidrug efflux system membrane fusion protein [Verrucomicrobiales bacterium]
MNVLRQAIIALLILALCWGGYSYLLKTKPEPPLRPQIKQTKVVEAVRLQPIDYQVVVETFGNVQPRTQSTLIPEVSGRVIEISESLREGGFFEAGDVLLKIDPVDYVAGVTIAAGELAQSEAMLSEQQARAEQAAEDWKRLGRESDPSDLVLRKPQLAEATARQASAEAKLVQARKDLERTTIRAPYVGIVREKSVDVGQYVSPGNVLARIYAIDYAEIRLPLKAEQLGFIDIPEKYRGDPDAAAVDGPRVTLHATFAGKEATWEGEVMRPAEVETATYSYFVVAQVKDPYARRDDGVPPLKSGMFVSAEIIGKTLEQVFVIPASAVREDREVLIIGDGGLLQLREVHIVWKGEGKQSDDLVVIDDGLNAGDVLCLTPLGFGAVGTNVVPHIEGEAPPEPKRKSRP